MYKLPKALTIRLKSLGLVDVEIQELIEKYSTEAVEYISIMLPNISLTPIQQSILSDSYIQYQLFAMVELESLVEDKKNFLDDMITQILKNSENISEVETKKNINSRRIKVF